MFLGFWLWAQKPRRVKKHGKAIERWCLFGVLADLILKMRGLICKRLKISRFSNTNFKKSVTTSLCPLEPQFLPPINLDGFRRLFQHEYSIISALKSLNSYRKAVEFEIKIRTVRVEETKERPEVFWLALTSKQALWLVKIYIGKISWLTSVS